MKKAGNDYLQGRVVCMLTKEVEVLREHIDERFDMIEKMVNLSLLSSLIDQMEQNVKNAGEDDSEIVQLESILQEHGFEVDKRENYENTTVIYTRGLKQINVPRVHIAQNIVHDSGIVAIPVFIFEGLKGNQRKRLMEEHISFYIPGRELHIIR